MGYDGLVLRNSSTSNSHQQQQQREKNASTSSTSTATAAAARLSPFASASSSSEAEGSDQLLSVLQMSMDDDSAGTFDLREPRLPAFRAISPPLLQHQHERFSSITPPPARSNSTPPGGLHDDFDMTATAGMVSDPALLQQFASLGLGDRVKFLFFLAGPLNTGIHFANGELAGRYEHDATATTACTLSSATSVTTNAVFFQSVSSAIIPSQSLCGQSSPNKFTSAVVIYFYCSTVFQTRSIHGWDAGRHC